ncbi:hypothetical protein ASO14_640 [Kurthia sp. 11kri321]|uniref:hypothetical protein n=1 Tax=unclassified Kurthia TaxID=2644826 RepID=UPI000745D24E|nr:hypothetical protein [Kurthia sp. 11kri321]AMA63068.1 hypothetical protein ASO14_640 [Kurthia sp. 11kri321]
MFDQLKAGFMDFKEKKAVDLLLNASVFEKILERQSIEGVEDLQVKIEEGLLILEGDTKVKKFGISKNIHFTLSLKPVHAEGRALQFELKKMKPLDFSTVHKKIFHKPPVVTYDERVIQIDLNAFDKVKAIPIGHIKEIAIQDEQFIVSIGL